MNSKEKQKKYLLEILILIVFGIVPVLISQLYAGRPRNRYIHIENFRYGKEPSVINCNRGDTLHLTFSSLDTGHSIFLQDYNMDIKVSPGSNKVLVYRPSNPQFPPLIKDTVVLVAKHSGLNELIVSKSTFHCHVYCGPMHAFEQGNLIIAPNTLLNFSCGILIGMFLIGIRRIKLSLSSAELPFNFSENEAGKDILNKLPELKKLVKKNWFQPILMLIGGFFLYIVLLTTLFGTKVSGRNLGEMLVWVVWLFLLISFLTPFGGRIWCMMCPLPTAGEFLQRRSITGVRNGTTNGYRNKFFGLNFTWPKRFDNGWSRLIAFLIAGTFSTALAVQPLATGIAILIFIITLTAMSLIFKLRTFCMYVCPINTFIGTYSQIGNLAISKTDPEICNNCKGDFCEKGSHTGWPCPYNLNVRNIEGNFDCGMCTECIRSCIHDNVTFRWRKFGREAEIKDISLAWTAMAMFVLGIVYTIVYLGPWPEIRDYINIIDKDNWGLFAVYAVVIWSITLLIFPLLMYLVTRISKWFSGSVIPAFRLMIASTGALLPIGLFVWIAFILQMLFINFTFVKQSLNDPFGWGWNLFGLSGIPWIQIIPGMIPWFQVFLVLIGFGYSFRNLWRIWILKTQNGRMALKGLFPLALFLMITTFYLIQFYAN